MINNVELKAAIDAVMLACGKFGMSFDGFFEGFWDNGSETAIDEESALSTVEAIATAHRESVEAGLRELGIDNRMVTEWALARFVDGYFHP